MQEFSGFEIKKVNMYEAVADKLEEMILSDDIHADEKLPSEQALANGFGVSRPVIREALMLLNARGLISQKNGEGTYISKPSDEDFSRTVGRVVKMSDIDISSLFEVRLALEVLSIRLATRNAKAADLEKLHDMLDEMIKLKDNNTAFANADVMFHVHIAEMSGNRILHLFVKSLTNQLSAMIEHNLKLDGANDDAIDYHKRLISAIAGGSEDRAGDIMSHHVKTAMKNALYAHEKALIYKGEKHGE